MFLSTITEYLKESVLDLALILVEADKDFYESAPAIMESFKNRLSITSNPKKRELKEILESLSGADITDKKKILFEITCLVYSDNIFSDTEREIFKEVTNAFQIEDDFVYRSIEIADDLNMLYYKANKLVTGKGG